MKTFVAIAGGTIRDRVLPPENIRLLASLGEVVFASEPISEASVASEIGNADVYMTMWGSPRLSETVLRAAPNLRLLVHLGGTVVPYVSDAMWERGIRVISGNEQMAESVAEGCIAYLLAALRDIPYYSRRLGEGKQWKKSEDIYLGLLDRKIGIVSLGTISQHLIRMLEPFHPEISVCSRSELPEAYLARGIRRASLDEIFSQSDIITVHTALNDQTRHMIGKRHFDMIRDGALLLNTSRGAVLDEEALIASLREGRYRAVLDVYEREPLPKESPLFTLPNVMLMPHMAGPTTDRFAKSTNELIREANAFLLHGDPLAYEIVRARAEAMTIG